MTEKQVQAASELSFWEGIQFDTWMFAAVIGMAVIVLLVLYVELPEIKKNIFEIKYLLILVFIFGIFIYQFNESVHEMEQDIYSEAGQVWADKYLKPYLEEKERTYLTISEAYIPDDFTSTTHPIYPSKETYPLQVKINKGDEMFELLEGNFRMQYDLKKGNKPIVSYYEVDELGYGVEGKIDFILHLPEDHKTLSLMKERK
mgnify:CR=1 FL=1